MKYKSISEILYGYVKMLYLQKSLTFVRHSLCCFVSSLTLDDNFEIIATTTSDSLFLRVISVSRRKPQILWCNAFYSNCIHITYLKLTSRIQFSQYCVETFHSCIFIHNAFSPFFYVYNGLLVSILKTGNRLEKNLERYNLIYNYNIQLT